MRWNLIQKNIIFLNSVFSFFRFKLCTKYKCTVLELTILFMHLKFQTTLDKSWGLSKRSQPCWASASHWLLTLFLYHKTKFHTCAYGFYNTNASQRSVLSLWPFSHLRLFAVPDWVAKLHTSFLISLYLCAFWAENWNIWHAYVGTKGDSKYA